MLHLRDHGLANESPARWFRMTFSAPTSRRQFSASNARYGRAGSDVDAGCFLRQTQAVSRRVPTWAARTTMPNTVMLGWAIQQARKQAIPRRSGGHGRATPRAIPPLMTMPLAPAMDMAAPSATSNGSDAVCGPSTAAIAPRNVASTAERPVRVRAWHRRRGRPCDAAR